MRSILGCLALALLAPTAAPLEGTPGEVFVLDTLDDAVVLVHPGAYETGDPPPNQRLVTSGNLLSNPTDVAIGDGELFVADRGLGGLVRIDLSDMSQSQVPVNVGSNPLPLDPRGVVLDSGGKLLVPDGDLFTIVQVDPLNGAAADLTPSIFFGGMGRIDLGPGDEIFMVESDGTIVRVLPQTQQREDVGSVLGARGLAVAAQTGLIYVTNSTDDTVVRIDPDAYVPGDSSANRVTISDDPLLTNPEDVGILPGGDLVVTNSSGGNFEMVRVTVSSGAATTVAMGGSLTAPSGLAVVLAPGPSAAALRALALAALGGLARRRGARAEDAAARMRSSRSTWR
jgi:DNA-binding beta-propeller fold protein YncE